MYKNVCVFRRKKKRAEKPFYLALFNPRIKFTDFSEIIFTLYKMIYYNELRSSYRSGGIS